jgi:hypothetical protein
VVFYQGCREAQIRDSFLAIRVSPVSLVRSKHSSSPAPSLSLITATVTVCAALAACGGAGDPNPTDVVAKSVAPEILAEPDPAVVVASAAADSRLDSVNAAAGPLEVALADATQTTLASARPN